MKDRYKIGKENMDCERNFIKEAFIKIGIELNELQINQFYKYYLYLVEKNKVMNLTAITEYEDVVIKHFVDSLLICKVKYFENMLINSDEHKIKNLIDIGTGAGFPGIPIKIVYPDIKITLLDSLNKRINFLNEVIEILDLKNITCIHGRAEDYGCNPEYREKYDICVSRAVANLSTLSEYCVPFIKVGGTFVSYKASAIETEVSQADNAFKQLGCKVKDVEKMNLSDRKDNEYERSFVIICKEKTLSKKYPRKSGIPSRNPL